jgi:Alginate export
MSNRTRVTAWVVGLALLASVGPRVAWSGEPVLDAQVRVREYVLVNQDFDSDADDANNYARMRTRVGMTFNAGDYSSAYVQFQDTRALGEPATTLTSLEQTDLHQAYVHVRNAFDSSLSLQIGRMEMLYGSERQIGPVGWSDIGRTFDGVRLKNDIEDFGWFHAFAMKLNETGGVSTIKEGAGVTTSPDGEQAFIGAYLHYDANENSAVEAYVFDVYKDQGDLTDAGSGDTENATGNLFTAGGRFTLDAPDQNVKLFGEGAVQFGSAPQTAFGEDGADYKGYAAVAGINYGLPTAVKSWVGFEFNIASGDDGTDANEIGTYQQLFPTSHGVLGYMDLVGWRNILDYQGTLGVKPNDQWKLWGSYHYFQVAESADSAYLASGKPWLTGDPSFDENLGSEIDFVATYSPEKNLSFLAKFGFWMPGTYQEQSTNAALASPLATPASLDSAMSVFVQTTATF